jgi:hypothetical protein
LSSFAVTCATLFLLLVPRPWRAHGSTDRRDGLGGIREVRAAPLPDLPPDGAALPIPAAPARQTEPVMPTEVALTAAPSERATPTPMSHAGPPVQNGARNDGFARFTRPSQGRHATTNRAAGPAEIQIAPTR